MADLPIHYYRKVLERAKVILDKAIGHTQEKDEQGLTKPYSISKEIGVEISNCSNEVGKLELYIKTLEKNHYEYCEIKKEFEDVLEKLINLL